MRVRFENAYSQAHPFWRYNFRNGEKQKLFAVLFLYECNNLGLTSYKSNSVKIAFLQFSFGTRAKIGATKRKLKTKNHARVLFHPFPRTPPLGRLL